MTDDFTGYYTLTDPELRVRYCQAASEQANLHMELAMVLSQERRAKVEGFVRSEETSVAGRERAADFHALELTTTVFELRGQQAAKTEELNVLKMLLGVDDAPS